MSKIFKAVYRPKKGELVINKKLVVLCTGYGNQNAGYRCFSGVVIVPDNDWPIGTYSRTWGCDAFEKLNSHIMLDLIPKNHPK